jgi:hypothetical protein
MLEVIQHQEHLGLAQGRRQGILHRGIARLAEAGGARHGCRHLIRVRDRGQRDEDDAVGKVRADLSGDRQSEGRLPDAAGAGQREEANVGATQEPEGQCELALSANERCEWHRRRGNPEMVRRQSERHDARQYAPARHAPRSIVVLSSPSQFWVLGTSKRVTVNSAGLAQW